jgi:hypothetical protein
MSVPGSAVLGLCSVNNLQLRSPTTCLSDFKELKPWFLTLAAKSVARRVWCLNCEAQLWEIPKAVAQTDGSVLNH